MPKLRLPRTCNLSFRLWLVQWRANILGMQQTPVHRLTDKQVGTYLVFRMKLNELIHLHHLFGPLHSGGDRDAVDGIPTQALTDTVRTCAMAWFCTFLDRNGTNIFGLWTEMFPQYASRLNVYRAAFERDLVRLRVFRDRSAFHAEPVFRKFLEPRVEMQKHAKEDVRALQRQPRSRFAFLFDV